MNNQKVDNRWNKKQDRFAQAFEELDALEQAQKQKDEQAKMKNREELELATRLE